MIGRRCKARERLSRAPLIGRALRDTHNVPSAPDRSQGRPSSSAVRPSGRPRHQKALRGLFAFIRTDLIACGFSSMGDRGWARCAGSFDHRGHDCCQAKLVMSQGQQTRHYIPRVPRTPGCTCSGDRGAPGSLRQSHVPFALPQRADGSLFGSPSPRSQSFVFRSKFFAA